MIGLSKNQLNDIFMDALSLFGLPLSMTDHGPSHWWKVFENVTLLSQMTPTSDRTACQLFALVHDCRRENEYKDPDHGVRAADVILRYRRRWGIDLESASVAGYACQYHNAGKTSDSLTIGCCWDADRLELPRVGIRIDPAYLSTQAGVELFRDRELKRRRQCRTLERDLDWK